MNINIRDKIKEWDKLSFSENPYGKAIPDAYLDSMDLLKDKQTLREQKQNGEIVSKVINDRTKESAAEKTNFVIFSKVFNNLLYSGTLCPSNYVSEVINQLRIYEFEHNKSFETRFYLGYISRSLRAFASYIRELNLQEFIINYYQKICDENGYSLTYNEDTLENKLNEDLHNKTDIYFKIENIPYRIWSYQATESGVRCTLGRVLRSKEGINLYIPFNIETKKDYKGWFLYNEKNVIEEITKTKTISFTIFRRKIIEDVGKLKNINKVLV